MPRRAKPSLPCRAQPSQARPRRAGPCLACLPACRVAGLRSTGHGKKPMRKSALSPCVTVWCVPSSPIAVICCGTGASAWVGQVGTRCALTGRFTVKQGRRLAADTRRALLFPVPSQTPIASLVPPVSKRPRPASPGCHTNHVALLLAPGLRFPWRLTLADRVLPLLRVDVPANHGAQQAVGQRHSALPRDCSPIARHIAQPIDIHKEAHNVAQRMRVLSFDSLRSALPCAPSGEGAKTAMQRLIPAASD